MPLGLIFLMFMVGLEFSLATLLAARTDVLLAGSLQMAATLATIAAALWWLGLDLRVAILLGGAAAILLQVALIVVLIVRRHAIEPKPRA